MLEENYLEWMGELPKRIPFISPTMSLIFGLINLLIYLAVMLSGRVEQFSPNIYSIAEVIFFCTLLVYLINYNNYLFNKTKSIIQEMNPIRGNEKQLYNRFREILFDSKRFCIIVLLVIFPFLIINYKENLIFNNFIFNIYNILLYILMLYLLASALSMILNISLILAIIGKHPCINFLKIDLFNADRIGGLGIIRSHIISIIIYYSIGISLAILSYIEPNYFDIANNPVIYEIFDLSVLLFTGIILLIFGLGNLQKPFRERMIKDLVKINEEYQDQYEDFTRIISDNKIENDTALLSITKKLDALHKERTEREKILNDNGLRYSYSAVIVSAIAFIMPIITLFEKMNSFGLIKLILDAFNIKY
jgi:hypothetical protein